MQSDNGKEFVAKVIKNLKLIWPNLLILNGRARHPESQGSVERANGDITSMLKCWMLDNCSLSWSVGLNFVQMFKNNSHHSTTKMTPYQALFGAPLKIGSKTSPLPQDMLERLETESDLNKLLKSQKMNKKVIDWLISYCY